MPHLCAARVGEIPPQILRRHNFDMKRVDRALDLYGL